MERQGWEGPGGEAGTDGDRTEENDVGGIGVITGGVEGGDGERLGEVGIEEEPVGGVRGLAEGDEVAVEDAKEGGSVVGYRKVV